MTHSTPQIVETLEAAKALLEKGWTQDCLARNADRKRVEPADESACTFCMSGAVIRATFDTHQLADIEADTYEYINRYLQGIAGLHWSLITVPYYNDFVAHTKEQVVVTMEKVIAKAKEELSCPSK